MAQRIDPTNGIIEILDGAQIANKLYMCLKSGQTAFSPSDTKLRDAGEIAAKYTFKWDTNYTSIASNRLPAHGWYIPKVMLKYGTTPAAAYANSTPSEIYFIDPTFDGTNPNTIKVGTVLYSSFLDMGSKVPATNGYYMKTTSNEYWRIDSSTSGVIAAYDVYSPPSISESFSFVYSSGYWNESFNQSTIDGINWSATPSTLYRLTSQTWVDSYNFDTGVAGNPASGAFIGSPSAQPPEALDFYLLRVSSGTQQSKTRHYKAINLSATQSKSSIVAGGETVTFDVSSTIAWKVELTNGSSSYASIANNTGQGNGEFTVTVYNNSGGARTVYIAISDNIGLTNIAGTSVSTVNKTISQAAYSAPPQYTVVPYYGQTRSTGDIQSDYYNCYFSNYTGNLYYSNYVYYTNTALTSPAPSDTIYCLQKGSMNYYPFSDSEFLIIF